jgi:hypothetical protein
VLCLAVHASAICVERRLAALIGADVSGLRPVVVSLGFLVGVDVGWRYEPGHAFGDMDLPLFFVDEVVVMGAQEGAVVGAGCSAV